MTVDTRKADEDVKEQLLGLVPTYYALAASSKVHFIQSLVSRLLVDKIFDAYFIGLSRELADELFSVEKHLSRFGKTRCYMTGQNAHYM